MEQQSSQIDTQCDVVIDALKLFEDKKAPISPRPAAIVDDHSIGFPLIAYGHTTTLSSSIDRSRTAPVISTYVDMLSSAADR